MHYLRTLLIVMAFFNSLIGTATMGLAQDLVFPMSETGDDQREYQIREPLTTGEANNMIGGGMASCKQLQGSTRKYVEPHFTSQGKALCHRVSKIKGLVDVKVQNYTVQVTKAKAFGWDELDAALRESFTGL